VATASPELAALGAAVTPEKLETVAAEIAEVAARPSSRELALLPELRSVAL